MVIGACVFVFATLQVQPVIASVLRMQGAPYFRDPTTVRNNFLLRLANKRATPHSYTVTVGADVQGVEVADGNDKTVRLQGGEEIQEPLILSLPDADFRGQFDVKIRIKGESGKIEAEKTVPFLGPFRE
jgi:hypothetical protein